MHKLLFVIILFTGIITISGCNNNEKQEVTLATIPVIEVKELSIPIYSEYVGEIYGQEDIPISARVNGFLQSIHFKEGSKVKKGQLLYTIDPESLIAASNAMQSKVASAQTQLAKALSDLNRIRPLAKANAVSKSDLDAAEATYKAAEANLHAAEANLESSTINLSYTNIKSPISGIIGKTNAKVGEFVGVSPNPIILNTVSKIDTVIVKFYITEAQYLSFAKHLIDKNKRGLKEDTDSTTIELQLADGSIYNQNGSFDFIDRSIDQNTGTILVQASFPNPDMLLRPGLYSKLKIKVATIDSALVIPQRCISELQGEYSVFGVSDSNTVEQLPIQIEYKTGNIALISKGLKAGQKIVIDALQNVRPGLKINPNDTTFTFLYSH